MSDEEKVKISHNMWIQNLRTASMKHEGLDEVIMDPTMCFFGKWMIEHENNSDPGFLKINKYHNYIHTLAVDFKKFYDDNDTEGMKRQFDVILAYSKEFEDVFTNFFSDNN